ncbi:MAG: gliding motility protein GldM [bacterium]
MAGYKETPRQKMIGMMYLVLTALLALNVSKQILDAFIVVNESMEVTNSNFSKKLDNTYSKFEKQYNSNPAKVGPYWQNAVKARKLSNDLEKFVDSLKYLVIMKTDGITWDSAKVIALNRAKKIDNYNEPTNFFIGGSEDGSKGMGIVLRNRIEDYKKQMLELIKPELRGSIKMGLETDKMYKVKGGKDQNWQMHNFYHTILAATVTILNKIKGEVYNAEFDVVNSLYSAISAEDYKFDAVHAKVIPKSRFVFSGEEYEAEILVAAYETKGKPVVRYQMGTDSLTPGQFANARVLEGEAGRVTLKFPAGGEGLQRYAGFIELLDPSGVMKQYHFNEEYNVAKPVVTISPTKMNVFYRDIDNPVSISVPGGAEKIDPSVSMGTIVKDGKDWIVRGLPANLTNQRCTVKVNAVFNGKPKLMGQMEFRVKSVPNPVAKIANVSEGPVSKEDLLANPYLIAVMENFDFALRFDVVSFKFVSNISGELTSTDCKGSRLPEEVTKKIAKAKRGQKIYFEEIKVKGPGAERKISGVILTVR